MQLRVHLRSIPATAQTLEEVLQNRQEEWQYSKIIRIRDQRTESPLDKQA